MADKPAGGFVLRTLEVADAPAFQTLRLQALREHPVAFFASPEEQAAMSLEIVAQSIGPSAQRWAIGAWQGEQLVATMGLQRHLRFKLAHKAEIGGCMSPPATAGKVSPMPCWPALWRMRAACPECSKCI